VNLDPSALRAQLPARFGNPEWEFTHTHVGADGVLAFSFHPKDPQLEAHILNKPIGPARTATTDEVRAAAAALEG